MIYLATSNLNHFYARFGELSASKEDVRWCSINNLYLLTDTEELNKLKAKYENKQA